MLLVIAISCSTTFFTAISVSALATNGKIKKGGAYYMISRNFGPGIGAAGGVLFWLGNLFGCAMYVLGAVECLLKIIGTNMTGSDVNDMRVIGAIILLFLFCINFVGLKYVAKVSTLFLVIVLLAIFSIYLGCFIGNNARITDLDGEFPDGNISGLELENYENNWSHNFHKYDYYGIIGIYFPSVTGVMAGANRSADL
mmetsp:Transcript_57078/g.86216  ORF Transcript_57078/g.86216 Transcript_57078/m.86216 type:complete len:198 (+) Transcript_57078:173-766(+)